jgi:hypothetical protein
MDMDTDMYMDMYMDMNVGRDTRHGWKKCPIIILT